MIQRLKSLTLVGAIAIINSQATAQPPTTTYTQGKYQASVPDWDKVTWDSLPALQQAGFIKIPPKLIPVFGYDPSRSWDAGQKSDQVVMLGDAEDAFKLGSFTLEGITKVALADPSTSQQPTLKDVGFVKWQTTQSLVKAIPGLGQLKVKQVKPILKLFGESGYLPQKCKSGTINDCIRTRPNLAKKQLGDIDLGDYSAESIPGLERTPIRNFQKWQQTYINQIPNLKFVPFAKMPQPIDSGQAVVGIASVVFGEAEQGDAKVGDSYYVSGSVVRGDSTVPKACLAGKKCAYLELGDFTPNAGLYGKRWASGTDSPQVKGGYGLLAVVNDGKEPTGRLVYGNGFKVVLTNTNESTGTADFALYFRICARPPFLAKTCTPYFIGPVPWIPVKENDLVIVGTGR
ncbi:hypothetical protein H6G80_33675 [Nostoc sp. FACHB-87]|uniref:hypothetical protein n=1 Tax=Nostocales TaxID=1161 RepID=UPI0016860771|nr:MULTISPECIES: hypothetical protein [Nostocales]MBD2303393.1 hypothetical protein [Nostoc sp. FACHB-190]MBD2458988.1 hypothetical protein [Nostoc sp. FACHB-87]MBD2479999.1 hypothetical protein [Anabaena sp. FACHB-83]MBD2492467.1 hypothetical protein [Aulosira sp. FACHB-615]